ESALGPKDRDAGRAFVIAADSEGKIDAHVNAVRVAQLELGVVSHRAEDANIRDDALARPDDRDELLGSKLTFLVEVLELGELGAGAEEDLQILRRHMHVPRRDIDDQRMRRPTPASDSADAFAHGWRRNLSAKTLVEHFADEFLDFAALELACA